MGEEATGTGGGGGRSGLLVIARCYGKAGLLGRFGEGEQRRSQPGVRRVGRMRLLVWNGGERKGGNSAYKAEIWGKL